MRIDLDSTINDDQEVPILLSVSFPVYVCYSFRFKKLIIIDCVVGYRTETKSVGSVRLAKDIDHKKCQIYSICLQ